MMPPFRTAFGSHTVPGPWENPCENPADTSLWGRLWKYKVMAVVRSENLIETTLKGGPIRRL